MEFKYASIENAKKTTMGVSSTLADGSRSNWAYIDMSAVNALLWAVKSENG